MKDIEYTLADYQDDFINGDKRVVSIVGAKGSSKTWSGARFSLVQITKQSRSQGLIMANSRPALLKPWSLSLSVASSSVFGFPAITPLALTDMV